MVDIEAFRAGRAAPFFRWFSGGRTGIVLNTLDCQVHPPPRVQGLSEGDLGTLEDRACLSAP